MGVSGWMFLHVPAYPGSPGQKAVKRLCVCVCLSVFSCTVLFVSISQVIGCDDRLWNDLYCVEWVLNSTPANQAATWIILNT